MGAGSDHQGLLTMDWNLSTAARTLWQEARGEPAAGQRAVAHVLNNRLKDGRWGNSLASVCLWHAGFSGWFSPRIVHGAAVRDPNFAGACAIADDDPALIALATLVTAASGEPDPTGGATHYYAVGTPEPSWVPGDPAHGIPAAASCGRFGNQLFFKGVR